MPAATASPTTLGETDLCRLEAALLDALLDVGATGSNAVDRLLNDPKLSASDRERLERFLAAAVADTHSDRNRILDDLLRSAPVV